MALQLVDGILQVEPHIFPPDDGRKRYTASPNAGVCCPICCRGTGGHSYLVWIANGTYLHCPVKEHDHVFGTFDEE